MQSIDKHIDLIILKFQKAMGHSEISQEKMRASIRDYLLEGHDSDMETLSVQMEIDQLKGVVIDSVYYKQEYTKIKDRLDERIKTLSYMGEDISILDN